MLESISVKNLALIKECEVVLGQGLNILTGETGAGKSIILGSIRLALGERARADMIRTGADEATVELVFNSTSEEVVGKMKELDLPIEEDGTIVIRRRIQEGRSNCKCNGETISSKALREIASCLLNIHGQNDTQTLLDSRNYIDIVDDYSDECGGLLEEMSQAYFAYSRVQNELNKELANAGSKDKEVALARFEVDEINAARLREGEDEELERDYRTMVHAQKIVESLSKAYNAMEDHGAAGDQIGLALREVLSANQYTDELEELVNNLTAIEDMVKDAARSISDYMDSCEYSAEQFHEVEDRLNAINRLKDKYGDSISDIIKYADERRSFVERMENYDNYIAELKEQVKKSLDEAMAVAKKLTEARRVSSKALRESMIKNLQELNFNTVELEIAVESDAGLLTDRGMDTVDFLVSFNVGEPVKSLGQIASGGELSRFMLALKAATADKELVDSLIFDEIDAGISGATAWSVAEKMGLLADSHQVIAITHLPQIAAMADRHFCIEKKTIDQTTVTEINRLDSVDCIDEIGRLLSGGELTESARGNAEELLAKAAETKGRRIKG